MKKKTVYLVYTHFPHYRQPVFEALSRSERYRYRFYYDPGGVNKTIESGVASPSNHHNMRTRTFGPLLWQSGAVPLALSGQCEAFVFLGNPFIVSTWIAAPIARIRGIKVFFWTHGWIRDEHGIKDWLRSTFYRMAHALLLYGERARQLGLKRGFADRALHVIGNSLNFDKQRAMRTALLADPERLSSAKLERPFFLVVSRLIKSARVDLAIAALAQFQQAASLVVVGEGPERLTLEAAAAAKSVDVLFTGALYSEEELAPYFLNCVAVVSPGKVGLLAMHALAYGAPVITHGDPDRQMPEFEAIEDGVTGSFFRADDEVDLAAKMAAMIANPLTDLEIKKRRTRAVATIEQGYTPGSQVHRIERALDEHGVCARA